MDMDGIVEKAKDALGGEEALEDKIQQAADFLKDKAPDGADGFIDKIAGAAHDAVDTDGQ